MNAESQLNYWAGNRYLVLLWFLRLVGLGTLSAFGAALMPAAWFVDISQWLGFEFPDSPLGYYLARNLSAMYGYVGLGILVLTLDIQRFGPLVWWLGWGAVSFGLLQLWLDVWSGLPLWWTLLEGLSTVAGGGLILAIARWCRAGREPNTR